MIRWRVPPFDKLIVLGACRGAGCLALAALALFEPHLAAQRSPAFIVGVLRRDGVIIPFAAHDGKRWSNAWPGPRLDLQVPITLAAVPKAWWGPAAPAPVWHLWLANSTAAHSARVTQLNWVDAHCLRQIGLKSDYLSDQRVPPPAEQPYPKDGIASTGTQPLLPIETVPLGTANRLFGAAGLHAKFNSAERETAVSFTHPITRRVRESAEPAIEAVYAFGQNPRAYYVEASRVYRKFGDNGCTLIAFGTGWLLESDGRTTWGDVAVDLLPCDKYGATYMLPLGALRLDSRVFWLAQYSGWDHERYVVVEVKKDKVEAAISAWGGGC